MKGILLLSRVSDVKNSFTEKCENCTTWVLSLLTMEMRLEHAEITASFAFSGRQAALNVGGLSRQTELQESRQVLRREEGEWTP